MQDQGSKADQGKPKMHLLDPYWEYDVAAILTKGAEVHGEFNWRKVEPERYVAAIRRHLNALARGELIDQDLELPHAACIACNSMFLHYFGRANQLQVVQGMHEITNIQGSGNNIPVTANQPQRASTTSLPHNDASKPSDDRGIRQLAAELTKIFSSSGAHKCSGARFIYRPDTKCIEVILSADNAAPNREFHISVSTLSRLP